MDPNKILFVTAVTMPSLYMQCVRHLKHLPVPKDFTVELLPVHGFKNLTAAYNVALQNDAKYKVYLHQDTFIINKFFIENLVDLFKAHPELGLVGVIGCKQMPKDLVWTGGKGLYGKVMACFQHFFDITFAQPQGPYESVEGVDGLLMATQYDLPWREDIVEGFHFYDAVHCHEFLRQGYKVGIPQQQDFWCLHYAVHHRPPGQEYIEQSSKTLDRILSMYGRTWFTG